MLHAAISVPLLQSPTLTQGPGDAEDFVHPLVALGRAGPRSRRSSTTVATTLMLKDRRSALRSRPLSAPPTTTTSTTSQISQPTFADQKSVAAEKNAFERIINNQDCESSGLDEVEDEAFAALVEIKSAVSLEGNDCHVYYNDEEDNTFADTDENHDYIANYENNTTDGIRRQAMNFCPDQRLTVPAKSGAGLGPKVFDGQERSNLALKLQGRSSSLVSVINSSKADYSVSVSQQSQTSYSGSQTLDDSLQTKSKTTDKPEPTSILWTTSKMMIPTIKPSDTKLDSKQFILQNLCEPRAQSPSIDDKKQVEQSLTHEDDVTQVAAGDVAFYKQPNTTVVKVSHFFLETSALDANFFEFRKKRL